MNKIILLILLISILNTSCANTLSTAYKAETNYSKSSTESLSTQLIIEYKIHLYESFDKAWACSINGKVNTDYDHFNNELHTNVFTTFGVDF